MTAPQETPILPGRWPVIVFVGPVVGTLVLVAWLMVFQPPATTNAPWHSRIGGAIQLFGLGWVIGIFPAMLAAYWWRRIELTWPGLPIKPVLGPVVGAISATVWLWPLLLVWRLVLPAFAPRLDIFIMVAVAGALAMAVTAPRWRGAQTISGAKR